MSQIDLTEYASSDPVRLDVEEVHRLRAAASNKISINPAPGPSGSYTITASSWVGRVATEATVLTINPKVRIEQVMFLISYALDPIRWDHLMRPEYGTAASIVEAVVPAFVAQTERALARGVLQGYRSEEEALLTVRGRIRFEEQIRTRLGVTLPIEVRYDEFTEDIEPNRIIKAAIRRLHRTRLRNQESAVALRRLEAVLANVASVEYGRQAPQITWNRLNERYRPAVDLARLIIAGTTPDLQKGQKRSSALLIDMNDVFERFVYTALREALQLSGRTFPKNARGRDLYLDTLNRIPLEPDLSWWEHGECVFVGDIKYKRVNFPGIKHPDLYQMLAYTTASSLPGGMIIYAKGEEEPVRHTVRFVGKTIDVRALDLSEKPNALLAQINRLASTIRTTRVQKGGHRAA